jgi:hypothetical protein
MRLHIVSLDNLPRGLLTQLAARHDEEIVARLCVQQTKQHPGPPQEIKCSSLIQKLGATVLSHRATPVTSFVIAAMASPAVSNVPMIRPCRSKAT